MAKYSTVGVVIGQIKAKLQTTGGYWMLLLRGTYRYSIVGAIVGQMMMAKYSSAGAVIGQMMMAKYSTLCVVIGQIQARLQTTAAY